MSSGTHAQLRNSYAKIIESTLKQVRDAGVLRDASREVIDELGCRWRAAVERELSVMESRQPERLSDLRGQHGTHQPLDKPQECSTILVPASESMAPLAAVPGTLCLKDEKPYQHMNGVSFAESFQLPAPPQKEALPAVLQCRGDFGNSHVTSPDGGQLDVLLSGMLGQAGENNVPGRAGSALVAGPPRKRPRKAASSFQAPPTMTRSEGVPNNDKPQSMSSNSGTTLATALMPALGVATKGLTVAPMPVQSAPKAALPTQPDCTTLATDDNNSDDEFSGVFDGAEVIVSSAISAQLPPTDSAAEGTVVATDKAIGTQVAAPAPVAAVAQVAAEDSSEGSELNSDLDDSEFDEPDTHNILCGEITKLNRAKKRWTVQLRNGILQVNGTECLFSVAHGIFAIADSMDVLEDNIPSSTILQ